MEYSARAKMPMSQRAKQFMPFAAVKGLEEALAKQEQALKTSDRPDLGEEKCGAINAMLHRIVKGMRVSVTHYRVNRPITCEGIVSQISRSPGYLKINCTTILFEDIISLIILK